MESIRLDALSGKLNSWLEADAAERERLNARLAASGELGGRPDGLDLYIDRRPEVCRECESATERIEMEWEERGLEFPDVRPGI